jgi:hypothetical protein
MAACKRVSGGICWQGVAHCPRGNAQRAVWLLLRIPCRADLSRRSIRAKAEASARRRMQANVFPLCDLYVLLRPFSFFLHRIKKHPRKAVKGGKGGNTRNEFHLWWVLCAAISAFRQGSCQSGRTQRTARIGGHRFVDAQLLAPHPSSRLLVFTSSFAYMILASSFFESPPSLALHCLRPLI